MNYACLSVLLSSIQYSLICTWHLELAIFTLLLRSVFVLERKSLPIKLNNSLTVGVSQTRTVSDVGLDD